MKITAAPAKLIAEWEGILAAEGLGDLKPEHHAAINDNDSERFVYENLHPRLKHGSPELFALRSRRRKEIWKNDLTYRKKVVEAQVRRWENDPNVRKVVSAAQVRRLQDPAELARQLKNLFDPAVRERAAKNAGAVWSDPVRGPEHRKKHKAGVLKAMTPAVRAAMSKAQKLRWENHRRNLPTSPPIVDPPSPQEDLTI
jgi:hypothetical protein